MTQGEKDRLERRRYWEDQVQKWRESGLNQTAYCRLHEINRHRFFYWKKYLLEGRLSSSLVEVSLNRLGHADNLSFSPLRLLIGSRYRIEVEHGFDPATLHQLLYALEGR